ncbi:MAG: hypothetical protein ACKVW3_12815 [Phycisphaerales bacterium]
MDRSARSARPRCWPLLAIVGHAWPALAHDTSIGMRVDAGRLATYFAEPFPPVIFAPDRVFPGDLFLAPAGIVGDEPGYLTDDPSPLIGQSLGFNIRRAARGWNGSDFNSLSPFTITLSTPGQTPVTTPMADPLTPLLGLSFIVQPSGIEFRFDSELNGTTPGLYLLELEAWTDTTGVVNSLPYWAVLNYDMSEPELERGIEWVRENLAPSPSTLVALALLPLVSRRRRRR